MITLGIIDWSSTWLKPKTASGVLSLGSEAVDRNIILLNISYEIQQW